MSCSLAVLYSVLDENDFFPKANKAADTTFITALLDDAGADLKHLATLIEPLGYTPQAVMISVNPIITIAVICPLD